MKVIIAGDDNVFLDGLLFLIQVMYPASNVEHINNWSDTKKKLETESLALVIVNHTLQNELCWLDELKKLMAVASCPICMIADIKTKHCIMEALKLGVVGVILKNSNSSQIKQLVDSAIKGKLYLPNSVWQLFEVGMENSNYEKGLLTRRQVEILNLVLEGNSNKNIADFLFIREGTVKQHLNNIYKALNVKNRVEAIYAAGELNLFKKPI